MEGAVEDEKPRTLFVGNVPRTVTKRDIETLFGDLGPLKRCFIQYPRTDGKHQDVSTIAYVTYALPEDATSAVEKLANHKIGDNTLQVKFAKSRTEQQRDKPQRLRPPTYDASQLNNPNPNREPLAPREKGPRQKPINKKPRLIVRNLSFQVTEERIRKHFQACGTIKDLNVLKKPNGKLVGCAFIQYENVHQAAKAIKDLNMKPFMGRPIAIDWALAKAKFQQADGVDATAEDSENKPITVDDSTETEVKVKEEPMDQSPYDYLGHSITIKNEEHESDEKKPRSLKRKRGHDNDSSSDEDDESDEDDDSDGSAKERKPRTVNENDAEEGKTLFLRNLEFETSEDKLKEFFEQFGPVNYAVLCKDRLTEHPKGTAFVKFRNAADLTKCMEKYEEDPDLFVMGRRHFYVALAMTRTSLGQKLQEGVKKEPSDKRNLFLVREGFIRPGTEAAEGMSIADVNKRASLHQVKKQMLKNLKIFISDKRLCVHNLSPTYTDKQLRSTFLKHAGEGAKITEARVMRDMNSIDLKGVRASKGYGFVAFTKHEHALKALRALNNNPKIFSPNRRPIVEFSLENRDALKAKEKRTEKSKEKLRAAAEDNSENVAVKKGKKKKIKTEASEAKAKNDLRRSHKGRESEAAGLPAYSGLTAKVGISSLPSLKAKGKISRKSLKPDKNKPKKNQQERRMREPKSRPKFTKDKGDDVDRLVIRHKQKTQADVESNPKNKRREKWYKS